MSENILDKGIGTDETLDFHARAEQKLNDGYELNISEYLSKGFEIFKKYPLGFIGFFLLIGLVGSISQIHQILGLVTLILSPAMTIGWFVVAKKIDDDEPFEFGDFFSGFKKVWPLTAAYLLISLLVIVGFVLLVIPGIYLAVAFSLALFPIYFSNLDITESLKITRKVITKRWFSFFLFLIVLILVNVLGLIALGIGILVSAPVTYLALYAAYKDIFGFDE